MIELPVLQGSLWIAHARKEVDKGKEFSTMRVTVSSSQDKPFHPYLSKHTLSCKKECSEYVAKISSSILLFVHYKIH